MKKVLYVLCIFSIIIFSAFSSQAFAQTLETEDDIFFIFLQVTLRNSDGHLVTYLESQKFSDVDKNILNHSLDQFASSMKIPIFQINDTKFQVFIIESTTEFDSNTLFANAYYEVTVDEQTYSAARFHFDGFLTSPGDEVTAVWTIARLL